MASGLAAPCGVGGVGSQHSGPGSSSTAVFADHGACHGQRFEGPMAINPQGWLLFHRYGREVRGRQAVAGWRIEEVHRINDVGWIVGVAARHMRERSLVMLKPITTASSTVSTVKPASCRPYPPSNFMQNSHKRPAPGGEGFSRLAPTHTLRSLTTSEQSMKAILASLVVFASLCGCAVYTPSGSVVVDPAPPPPHHHGKAHSDGKFCPPGQAKKGNC